VFVTPFKRSATIVRLQLHKQTALVSAGTLDYEVPLRDLAEPKDPD
jgi:hypothetical protein